MIMCCSRHSRGLQGLGYTMRASYKELMLILMFVGIGVKLWPCDGNENDSCLIFWDHTHHCIPQLKYWTVSPHKKSLFNFCNFGHFVESYQRSGYWSFYQILHNLQMVFVLPILAMATTLRGFWWKNLSKILFLMHTINMTKATVDAHHWHRHQGADLLGLDLHVREGDRLHVLHLGHWCLLVGLMSI